MRCSISWVLFVVYFSIFSRDAGADDRIYEVLRLADEHLSSLGYKRDEYRIESAEFYRTVWNPITRVSPDGDYAIAVRNRLKGKRYWFVHYLRREVVLGGDVGIFVDDANGSMIFVYRGK